MQHSKCLICNSGQLADLKGYSKAFLTTCKNCGFVFSKNIPSSQELSDHYAKYPRNSAISPITVRRYGELLDSFEPFRKLNTILDVGCGDGHFLAEALKRGWNVFGSEFTDDAISICRQKGIQMHQGGLTAAPFGETKFDVITSFEVIEHINNPQPEISNIKGLLGPEGVLYITTPNFNALSRRILGEKWNVIEYPEHLSYYTPRTLNYLLSGNGFKKVSLISTGISLSRISESINEGSQTASGSSDEGLRELTEDRLLFKFAKRVINSSLSATGSGDTIKALFQKKD